MKKIFSCLIFLFLFSGVYSQEKSGMDFTAGVDIYSRYIWRGLLFSDAPNIQPYMSISKGGVSLMAWGSYATSTNYDEIDFFLSYAIVGFTVGVNDYYTEDETEMSKNDFSDWSRSTTAHLGEAFCSYTLPVEKFPLQILASVFVYGADLDNYGDQNYSTYFELMYPFKAGENELSFTIGGSPGEGFYSSDGGVVNVSLAATRNIKITESFTLPLNFSLTLNPDADDIFFVVGLSF